MRHETEGQGFDYLSQKATLIGVNSALVAAGMIPGMAIAHNQLKVSMVTKSGALRQHNGVLIGIYLDACPPEVSEAVNALIGLLEDVQRKEQEADPVVLWDPETGAVTDSQLTEIVEAVQREFKGEEGEGDRHE
ncbi:MAG: hypothetical protein ACRDL7_05930 [Gaiellaceae bacterium]